MAKDLNKHRMRNTRFLLALTIALGFFATTYFPDDTLTHEVLEFIGYVLVTACAIGRIYSTAFIGGIKNEKLVTVGPYSLVRNPLYLFSLIGAAGIGLMSTSLIAFVIIFLGFFLVYNDLIRREEEFLLEKFGREFKDYSAKVPRLWPSFRHYDCPQELVFQPRFLTKSVWDAIWWFAPFPLFELADHLKEENLITPVMRFF